MTFIKLNFLTFTDNGQNSMYLFEMPQEIQNEIVNNLNLKDHNEYICSFSRFVDFDNDHHMPIVNHIFNNLPNNIIRIPNNNDIVTYNLIKADEFLENLLLDDLIFVCAIFHNLDLKKYLLPIVKLTMKKHNISFNDLVDTVKNEKYKMNIFAK